jgi:hypothetical protein
MSNISSFIQLQSPIQNNYNLATELDPRIKSDEIEEFFSWKITPISQKKTNKFPTKQTNSRNNSTASNKFFSDSIKPHNLLPAFHRLEMSEEIGNSLEIRSVSDTTIDQNLNRQQTEELSLSDLDNVFEIEKISSSDNHICDDELKISENPMSRSTPKIFDKIIRVTIKNENSKKIDQVVASSNSHRKIKFLKSKGSNKMEKNVMDFHSKIKYPSEINKNFRNESIQFHSEIHGNKNKEKLKIRFNV